LAAGLRNGAYLQQRAYYPSVYN